MKRIVTQAARFPGAPGALGVDVAMAPPSSAALRRIAAMDLGDIAARAVIIVAFSFLAIRFGAHFAETGKLTGLLLLANEALVVALTVLRRPTGVVDRSLRARVLTTVSLIGPLLLVPVVGATILPDPITVTLTAAGLVIVVLGKLSLGRSFGLMPANRGVVSTGLYRLVRHPIYMGYLICHVGFIAANLSAWNLVALIVADVALMVRAVAEENVLARDPAYRDYLQQVRWRVAPGLF